VSADPAADCPEFLSLEGRAEWVRLVSVLRRRGLMDDTKRAAIEAYCAAYGRWREAEQFIIDRGLFYKNDAGVVVANPMLDVSREASRQLTRYMKLLDLVAAGTGIEDGATPLRTDDIREFFPGVKH
jgi:P27 family predicted phage terminase small subunit